MAGSGFSGFSGGDVITATRRVRDGEDSDEEWEDDEDELKNDPSWSPAGRSLGSQEKNLFFQMAFYL